MQDGCSSLSGYASRALPDRLTLASCFATSCPAQQSLWGSMQVLAVPLHLFTQLALPIQRSVGVMGTPVVRTHGSMVGMWCPGVPSFTPSLGPVWAQGQVLAPGNRAGCPTSSSTPVSASPLLTFKRSVGGVKAYLIFCFLFVEEVLLAASS